MRDREFDLLNREIPVDEAEEIYQFLERQYYKLTTKRPDPELSLDVIRLLAPLYGVDAKQVPVHLQDFVTENEDTLHEVYEHAEESDASVFLYQPEALMIFDRLSADQASIREVWNTQYPEKELERLATAFGISLD